MAYQTRSLIAFCFVPLIGDSAGAAEGRPGEVRPELHVAGTGEGTATAPGQPARKPRRRHLLLDVSIIGGVVVVYVLSLLGYHWLATAPGPLPEPVLNTADGTVVLVRFEQLHTVANRLDVKVLVMPDSSMIDKHLNVLNTDTSVRFFPQNDLGDLQYPVGKLPAQVATTIEAHGDPGDWPFDSYKTDTIQADVLVGSGENRQLKPGRVEVTGKLDGWDISASRVARNPSDPDRPDNVVIELH